MKQRSRTNAPKSFISIKEEQQTGQSIMKNLISDTIRQSLAETLPQRCFDTFSGFSLKSAEISPLISQTKAADFQISKGHQLLKNIDLHHPKQSNQKPLESDRTQTCTKTSHKTTQTPFSRKKARDSETLHPLTLKPADLRSRFHQTIRIIINNTP